MEFWGAEVKSGQPLSVKPGEGMILHLSQASLGEVKGTKGNDSVYLFVNVDGKKIVLGTLSSEKLPQQQFDLVFDRDFELSHSWANGSVHFLGYRAHNPVDDSEDEENFGSDSEDELPLTFANNGKPEAQVKQEKPTTSEKANAVKDSAAGKQKVKIVEPSKDVKPGDDDESSEEDVAMSEDDFDSDEDDESDSAGNGESGEEKEETPKKVELGKKRAAESATKTPAPDKKAKVDTPKKADGKKGGGHVATPHPSKQAGKTPANKSNQQTPKSPGSVPCKSCNKTFGSEKALESHTKDKHSAGK
ncbi:unnamed protein product [Ilex paraguariensis]|uniref:C2H2-type domain-containing protein n=1 Tax=Ilex paraguariensis TaxID=185542 RepID=A0ABC8TFD5_9AQUA